MRYANRPDSRPRRAGGLAALTGALLVAGGYANAAGPEARAAVEFRIVIPAILQLRLHDHPRELVVSVEDAERGYVVVRGPRIEIAANQRTGVRLGAGFIQGLIAAVEIEGLDSRASFETPGDSVPLPGGSGSWAQRIEYRLRLAPEVAPGRYPWPVSLWLGRL